MRHLTKPQLAMIVLAVVYLVSPVDVIPELLLGPLGLTDDAAALTVLITTLLIARGRAQTQSDGVRADVIPATPIAAAPATVPAG